MKKINKLFFTGLNAMVLLLLVLQSCDKMDDIQKTYAEREEQVYLGKVDSIKVYPGFGRAKLVWQINADPRIDQTIIYWNNRRDSVIKQFSRTAAGTQRDSTILENLPLGSSLVEFVNVNSEGQRSLMSSATVTTWGQNSGAGLRERTITSFNYNYGQSIYDLALSPAAAGDSVVYSQVTYTTTQNVTNTVRIERGSNIAALPDLPQGAEFKFRTVFFPPQGIDTLYGEYKTYKAPTVVNNPGVKIALRGISTSRYFDYNGDLGEWTSAGDLIVYAVAADGSLTQKDRYPALALRTALRELFYYYDNKFVGITPANQVRMYQIVNRTLTLIQTPNGVDNLGTGFSMTKFAPASGFFYSISATGVVQSWLALPNVTWGTPNGVTVQEGFTHDPFVLFNYQSLLGVDAAGYLWSFPVSFSGSIGAKSAIGVGWRRFFRLFSVGDKLYGIQNNGDVYVFNNFTIDKYWVVN